MRAPTFLIGAVALLLTSPALAAAAQGPFRQDVVVTAAATPVELGTVTRTLTVITRDQIARLPVHSIADVLRLTASVDVLTGKRSVLYYLLKPVNRVRERAFSER